MSNGYLVWEQEIGESETPIIVGNYVFVVNENGYFINIDKTTGQIIWSTNILKVLKKRKQQTKITGFIIGSGKVYASTINGYLIISSASSGKVESFKKVGEPIIASPIISNGAIYILTENSRLLGFN